MPSLISSKAFWGLIRKQDGLLWWLWNIHSSQERFIKATLSLLENKKESQQQKQAMIQWVRDLHQARIQKSTKLDHVLQNCSILKRHLYLNICKASNKIPLLGQVHTINLWEAVIMFFMVLILMFNQEDLQFLAFLMSTSKGLCLEGLIRSYQWQEISYSNSFMNKMKLLLDRNKRKRCISSNNNNICFSNSNNSFYKTHNSTNNIYYSNNKLNNSNSSCNKPLDNNHSNNTLVTR